MPYTYTIVSLRSLIVGLHLPPWVRPHQYWWRRTHDLNELFLEELMVAAKGKGAAGCASVRHCVVVHPSDRRFLRKRTYGASAT
jgi:hypothetical protein